MRLLVTHCVLQVWSQLRKLHSANYLAIRLLAWSTLYTLTWYQAPIVTTNTFCTQIPHKKYKIIKRKHNQKIVLYKVCTIQIYQKDSPL